MTMAASERVEKASTTGSVRPAPAGDRLGEPGHGVARPGPAADRGQAGRVDQHHLHLWRGRSGGRDPLEKIEQRLQKVEAMDIAPTGKVIVEDDGV